MDTAYFLNAVSHLNHLFFCINSFDSILIRVLSIVGVVVVVVDDDDGVDIDGDND